MCIMEDTNIEEQSVYMTVLYPESELGGLGTRLIGLLWCGLIHTYGFLQWWQVS